MKYKAIISDIDGTLTKNGGNSLPSKIVLDAIKKAEEKGITFTLATGRPLFFLTNLLEYMKLKVTIIFDNGAGIYETSTKKVLWESTMDSILVNQLITELAKTKQFRLSFSLSDGSQPQNLTHIKQGDKVRKIAILGLSPKEADTITKKLESEFKTVSLGRASSFSGEQFSDVYITKPDATKQHAVLKLAELLNISTHEMIGIGDHYNDFPLLMACGLKVAMGNAVPELKEIADYIAPDVEHDGVADVIEKFVLNS